MPAHLRMNLHLPQFVATEEEIDRSPNTVRAIRRWQKGLSFINMGETTRVLFHTLKALNRQPIPTRTRFEIMETIRPSARIVLNHLAKHLAGATYPLTGKSLQIAKLAHSILQEMAVGYKHVTYDYATHKDKVDRKIRLVATHRAMRYLQEAMARNAALYRTDPRSTWHDMHRLLGYAEHHKFHREEVEDEDYRTIRASTIEDVYKQACLLAMTQPLRLRRGEADKLRTYFETACHLVEMKKSLSPDVNGMVHVVSLKSSEPPAYIPLADITIFSNLRGFDMSRLISTLNDILQAAEEGEYQPGFSKIHLEPALIRRLITSWTTQEKRRFSRVATRRSIVAAVGLRNIIHAINADLHPELSKEEMFRRRETDTREVGEWDSADPFNGTPGSPDESLSLDAAYHAEFLLGQADDDTGEERLLEPPESWMDWQVLNTGAGGYGLLWDQAQASNAQVGELIALREKEYDLHHWRIGIIRWIRNRSEGELEAGVQLIAPRTVVVSVETILNRSHEDVLPMDALMLPGMKTINQPPSLLLPNHVAAVGDILEINMLGRKLHIELKSIGEHPSFFTQFFYRSTEVTEAVNSKEEFEDLWGRL